MILQIVGIVSGVLAIVQFGPYVRDILRGTTKPERASWLIWTLLGMVIFATQLFKGGHASLWMPAMQVVGNTVVFGLSIKFGVGGLNRRDVFALIAAAFGLALWFTTSHAEVALVVAIAVDAIGAALTMLKTWRDPDSETLLTWLLSWASGITAAVAVGKWNYALVAYPIYVAVANTGVIVTILYPSWWRAVLDRGTPAIAKAESATD